LLSGSKHTQGWIGLKAQGALERVKQTVYFCRR
jgi:hypothetical protein